MFPWRWFLIPLQRAVVALCYVQLSAVYEFPVTLWRSLTSSLGDEWLMSQLFFGCLNKKYAAAAAALASASVGVSSVT